VSDEIVMSDDSESIHTTCESFYPGLQDDEEDQTQAQNPRAALPMIQNRQNIQNIINRGNSQGPQGFGNFQNYTDLENYRFHGRHGNHQIPDNYTTRSPKNSVGNGIRGSFNDFANYPFPLNSSSGSHKTYDYKVNNSPYYKSPQRNSSKESQKMNDWVDSDEFENKIDFDDSANSMKYQHCHSNPMKNLKPSSFKGKKTLNFSIPKLRETLASKSVGLKDKIATKSIGIKDKIQKSSAVLKSQVSSSISNASEILKDKTSLMKYSLNTVFDETKQNVNYTMAKIDEGYKMLFGSNDESDKEDDDSDSDDGEDFDDDDSDEDEVDDLPAEYQYGFSVGTNVLEQEFELFKNSAVPAASITLPTSLFLKVAAFRSRKNTSNFKLQSPSHSTTQTNLTFYGYEIGTQVTEEDFKPIKNVQQFAALLQKPTDTYYRLISYKIYQHPKLPVQKMRTGTQTLLSSKIVRKPTAPSDPNKDAPASPPSKTEEIKSKPASQATNEGKQDTKKSIDAAPEGVEKKPSGLPDLRKKSTLSNKPSSVVATPSVTPPARSSAGG